MASDEVMIAKHNFEIAFERATALGVNVKARPPALPSPDKPYVIQIQDLYFEERGAYLKQLEEPNRSTSV